MTDHAASPLPSDIPGVLARLDEIVDWSRDNASPAGYFAAVYRGVTQTIKDEIEKGPTPGGTFDDPERMRRFDVVFANRFIAAFDAWRAGAPLSPAWHLALDTSKTERLALEGGSRFARLPILIHLLLGVNAHMNLDLGCAATEIAPGDEFDPLHGDFITINKVLASKSPRDRMQEERVAPLERFVDRWHWLSGHVIDLDIELRRKNSWEWASAIAHLTGEARTSAIAARDHHVHSQGVALLEFVQDRFWASPRHLLVRPVVLLDAWTTKSTLKVIDSFSR